jgi:glycosyltransferase involved in cell wall biosynthesis
VPDVLVLGGAASGEPDDSVPDQIAYGVPFFAARGYRPLHAPAGRWPRIDRLQRRLRPTTLRMYAYLLLRQAEALGAARRTDLVYALGGPQMLLLPSLLRRLRLLDTPLVCLAHQRPGETLERQRGPRGLFAAAMRGCDALPSLSSAVAGEVVLLARQPGVSPALAFGPDAGWYPQPEYPGEGVIAVGMAGRDFDTFGRAAARTGCAAQIVCPTAMARRLPAFGAGVRVVYSPNDEWLPYGEVMRLCAAARVHAIPLLADGRLYGLNSLADALALGKPVVMTRIPEIDLDIEAEGVGRWVAPGDVEGWRAAIEFFADNPEEAVAMGARARALVDDGLNSEAFAHALIDVFDAVLAT